MVVVKARCAIGIEYYRRSVIKFDILLRPVIQIEECCGCYKKVYRLKNQIVQDNQMEMTEYLFN